MQTALNLATRSYDINNNNCANFALECFNSIRGASDKLNVPNTIRGAINYNTTPNGIYELLQDKKNNNDPESASIKIGRNFSSFSKGSCD